MTANRSDQQQSWQDPERAFTSGNATEAGINPGLPGRDQLQHWWTHWWGHCLPHKDFLSSYRDPPPSLANYLLHLKPNPSVVQLDPKERKRETKWWWKDSEEMKEATITIFLKKVFYVSFNLNGVFLYCFFKHVSSTNRSVGFGHQWLCCQTVEPNTRSYLIVNSINKSIVLLQLRLLHFQEQHN